jgi:hypothetical protein
VSARERRRDALGFGAPPTEQQSLDAEQCRFARQQTHVRGRAIERRQRLATVFGLEPASRRVEPSDLCVE